MTRAGYHATPDRAGWALATGMAAVAAGAGLVGWSSGAAGAAIAAGAVWAGLLAGLAMVMLGGPVWWLVGRRRGYGPVAAGSSGAAVAAAVTLAALTRGFGLGLPVAGVATGAMWLSAAAMAVAAAFLGGLIALAMWLVAYRPG